MSDRPTTDLAVLERLVQPAGKDVVDVGCGTGALVRDLAARGARVTGVEISASQLAPAIAADDGRGARYLVGRGEDLPLGDATVDAVVFMRTLHHVPVALMPAALAEARRVLRPGGALYAAEPLPEGEFFSLTSLVEDETEVRAAAQDALAAPPGFERVTTVDYAVRICLRGVEALRERVVRVDPDRAPVFDVRRSVIEDLFARVGTAGERPDERCFESLMRAALLRKSRDDVG